jgi:hypothetical protein
MPRHCWSKGGVHPIGVIRRANFIGMLECHERYFLKRLSDRLVIVDEPELGRTLQIEW